MNTLHVLSTAGFIYAKMIIEKKEIESNSHEASMAPENLNEPKSPFDSNSLKASVERDSFAPKTAATASDSNEVIPRSIAYAPHK